jgi:hypothetical protein
MRSPKAAYRLSVMVTSNGMLRGAGELSDVYFEADRVRDAYSPPGNTNRYRFTMMVPASS